jgi:hypothetical protein
VTLASVTQLSPATRAIIAFHGSGKVLSLTFVRGNTAFALSDSEARRLAEALRERQA